MRREWRVRRWLPVLLLATGGTLVFAVLGHAWGERREIDRQAAQSRAQLALHARALEQLVDRYRALPQVLALDPELRAAASGPVDEATRHRLNLRLEEANRTAQASTLTLIDARGTAVAASNWREPGSNVGEHYGFRPYVRQALAEGQGRFYGIGVTTGVPGYFLSERIHGAGGEALGVVVIKIQLSALEREWLRVDGTVMVSDRHGVVFLASQDHWRYRALRPLDAATLRELDATRQYGAQPLRPMAMQRARALGDDVMRVRIAAPARQGEWLWIRAPLQEPGWTLHLLRDLSAATAAAARQAAIAAALLWLALVLLGLFVQQRRRITALRQRNRAELEALVQQHAQELRTARDGVIEAARHADSGLSRQLDHLAQGVAIIDADLRLTAWNQRYLELFRFPPGFIHVGRPIEDVFRYNAERGLLGPGPVEDAIQRRLDHLRSGTPHARESEKQDGTVLEIRGNPLPDGGFVTSYADITGYKNTARELRSLADALERRIADRTADLEQARHDAEQANRYKTRFVAAAVHDLLQPLNAARMFLSALRSRLQAPEQCELSDHVEAALAAQDAVLTSLLDISRMEAGTLAVDVRAFALDPLLDTLAREFGMLAAAHGLAFAYVPTRLAVRSDEALLRRILQNFLSNAVRYTRRGRIVLGCRRDGGHVRIEVHDQGPGIPDRLQREVFEEFRRLDDGHGDHRGAGLGLAIVERIGRLLGHRIDLRSQPGRGSVFAVSVPGADAAAVVPAARPAETGPHEDCPLHGCRCWCIDDDPRVCEATRALLERWGCVVPFAGGPQGALAAAAPERIPQVVLLDVRMDGIDGPALYEQLCTRWRQAPPVVLVTAERDAALQREAADRGWGFLHKPVRAPALRALMSQILLRHR
ncbi:hybrid sensor histidine kinase/response regulator [Luteimonas saliphila]|uniref:hybrid sensor histidine kinase/response regulator n=1 Tax=Luteimonas saliphila TaxID=2804919 RepID=UPI00192D6330|nr:PAS-domain containing protein [Luteimonas saliphila]